MSKNAKHTLPEHAPKRTGRRMPPPEDRPRQGRLPSMEDARIQALESGAEEYVRARDERMALTEVEVETKGTLLRLMHEHGKTHYKHNGYEISVVAESEKLKVKVQKEEE
jgi:hypothetical protein